MKLGVSILIGVVCVVIVICCFCAVNLKGIKKKQRRPSNKPPKAPNVVQHQLMYSV